MLKIDEKTGEVADKDISRSECPFRSITDRKRKFHDGYEHHVYGKTKTQAEQYVPMLKMIERMLRGEDVEMIREMLKPLDVSSLKTPEDVDNLLEQVVNTSDLDPADLVNQPIISTETRASVADIEQKQANSSSGDVGDTTTADTKAELE